MEGVYAVAKKERLRTRNGATYLALQLVDPSGRIDARVWNDVELLDARFAEGDAVRVLGRVERFRDRLQLEVRTLEPAEGVDPEAMAPAMRRDADELEGFLEFLAAEIHDDGLRTLVDARARGRAAAHVSGDAGRPPLVRGRAARAHRRRRDDLPRAVAAPSAPPRRSAARGRARPRRRAHARAGPAAAVPADGGGEAARPRAPRPADARRGRRAGGARCTRSRATTTCAPRARPRRPSSTTRTSSTRSPRRGRFRPSSALRGVRSRSQPRLGRRRLPRRAEEPRHAGAVGDGAVAAVRARRARHRGRDARHGAAGAGGVVGVPVGGARDDRAVRVLPRDGGGRDERRRPGRVASPRRFR